MVEKCQSRCNKCGLGHESERTGRFDEPGALGAYMSDLLRLVDGANHHDQPDSKGESESGENVVVFSQSGAITV